MKRVANLWKRSGRSGHRLNPSLRLFVVYSVIGACLSVSAYPREQSPSPGCALARPHITSAQTALSRNDSDSARQELNRAIEMDPTCAEAYLRLGLIEFQTGATTAAIPHYQQALKLQPRSYSAHYNLALAYLREHKLQDARRELEYAVSLNSSQPDAVYDLGITLLELGEPALALNHLRHAKRLTPRSPDVAFNIVRAELEAGNIAQARAEAQAAAKRFHSDFQWMAAIGQLFFKNKQAKDAASYLSQANSLRPNQVEVSHQLVLAYLESGQPEEVLNILKDAKTPDDYYLRASAYYMLHDFPKADQDSAIALERAPSDPKILVLRTRLLQRAGLQEDALRMAQQAITLAPTWDEPYYLAGVSSYFIRLYEEAERNLARAVDLNPNSARALFLQSIALGNLGRIDDSEHSLRRAIALQPVNARLHCHLGILLARRNEGAAAQASFRKAIQLKPDYALPHYQLGKLLVSENQLRPAANQLEQAIVHDPGLSAAYYQLGRLYARLGESEKSKRLLSEFRKRNQQPELDSQSDEKALEEDARRATQLP